MKMNFPQKSKPNGNRWKIYSVAVLFCLLIILSAIFPKASKTAAYAFGRPVWIVRDGTAKLFKNFGGYFVSKDRLIKENLSLEDQLASLELKVADYDSLQHQNEDLKTLLGRSGASSRTLARVLSKPPTSPYDTLVIDVGSSDGIIKGSQVYLSDSVIIGLVTDVTARTSLVTLFSSGGQKIQATDERTGAMFEISGRGGANMRIDVPKDTDIVWGDVFEYPALTSSVMGVVNYIDSNSQSSFKSVYLRTPGNVFGEKWVFVEKSKGQN